MTGVYIHHLKHLCGGDDAMNFLRTIRVSWWQVCLSNNHPTSQNSCCGNPKLSVLRTNHSGCSGQAFTTAQAVCRITWSPLWFQELEWSTRTIGLGRMAIARVSSASLPRPAQPRAMGNKNDGKGLFAPIVVIARNAIGKKEFNQLRGKAIALHSQVIGEFCKTIGADSKQKQGLIRLAKKNGEKLGFLA
uniref:Proton gradient regulation 5 n=1 Tax=Physcomitrium patens TaxID=3218 RepID=A0A7I4CL71_PHYPA